jgi:TPR repeat protein
VRRRGDVISGAAMAGLLVLSACGTPSSDSAPSPSDSYGLSVAELNELTAEAERGDVIAMNRLALYYGVNQQDDRTELAWLERAADAGDSHAREFLFEHYSGSKSPEERNRAKALKERWELR